MAQGAPIRQPGKTNVWVWVAVGCGMIVIVGIFLIAIAAQQFSRNPAFRKTFDSISQAPQCGENLREVREALRAYRKAHDGKYPAALKDLTPQYLPDADTLTCGGSGAGTGMTLEYTPPKPNAPGDTPIVSFRGPETSFIQTQTQVTLVRLLADGRIVLDQVSRTELKGR